MSRASNKSSAGQSFLTMKTHKDAAVDHAIHEQSSKKRKQVVEQNGSCLTCSYTKSQSGIFLICSLKDKKVREYNYCENWKSDLEEETKNV